MSLRFPFGFVRLSGAAAGCMLASGGILHAQSAGAFVIPNIRAAGGTQFAYWDLFQKPPGQTYNFNYANPPALSTGVDEDGNPSSLLAPRAVLVQTGSATCFVTSSGALYDFAAATAFETRYTQAAQGDPEVTNVIFQTQTGGRRFDLNNIRLVFNRSGETVSLPAQFKALDDPQSGAFAERLVSAFQWNLTGQSVHDFRLVYSAPDSSMPLWQAQLDVVSGAPFVQELGYLLLGSVRPVVRYGRPGVISKNLPSGAEERFFLPGATLHLTGDPSPGWAHTGWLYNGSVITGAELPVTFTDKDLSATALFAPQNYDDWRDAVFFHSNEVIGEPADNTNDEVSGPEADADADGMNNFAEFAFGGDPYTSDAERMTPEPSIVTANGQAYAALTWRQGAGGSFPEISYKVRVSSDLHTWVDNTTANPPVTVEVSRQLQSDGTTLVTTRSTVALTKQGKLFLSLKAE